MFEEWGFLLTEIWVLLALAAFEAAAEPLVELVPYLIAAGLREH